MADEQEKSGLTRRGFIASLSSTGLLGASGCAIEEDIATAEQQPESSPPTEAPRSFRHPGLLHTEEDFERMRTKVAAQAEPGEVGREVVIDRVTEDGCERGEAAARHGRESLRSRPLPRPPRPHRRATR